VGRGKREKIKVKARGKKRDACEAVEVEGENHNF